MFLVGLAVLRILTKVVERGSVLEQYGMALPVRLDLGNGRHESALARSRAAPPEKSRESTAFWYQPDIVEAAAQAGDQDRADAVTDVYETRAEAASPMAPAEDET